MVKAAKKPTKAQIELLGKYAHTGDGQFMQQLPGAHKLWMPLGLLKWQGDSYGCHFYSITEAGKKALADGL